MRQPRASTRNGRGRVVGTISWMRWWSRWLEDDGCGTTTKPRKLVRIGETAHAGERGRPRGAEASRAAHDNKQGNVLLIAEICQCLRMASWLAILNGRLPTETYRCGRQRSDRGPEAATRSRERGGGGRGGATILSSRWYYVSARCLLVAPIAPGRS